MANSEKLTTRIIPGLKAEYQIVSLPYWAWFWLEDFMRHHKINYKGIYKTFETEENIGQTLHNLAELHQEHTMRELHKLANDNEPQQAEYVTYLKDTARRKEMKQLNLPKIYKLFGFISCYTTLDAVWQRKNCEEDSKIK